MGLKERKAVKEFQDVRYPDLKNSINKAAGFDVNIEVDWDTLAENGYDHLYNEAFPKVYFIPLINALNSIACDEMGKQALNGGLKKVSVNNKSGVSNPSRFVFSNGELIIDHAPCANINDLEDREKKIKTLLENAL